VEVAAPNNGSEGVITKRSGFMTSLTNAARASGEWANSTTAQGNLLDNAWTGVARDCNRGRYPGGGVLRFGRGVIQHPAWRCRIPMAWMPSR
jgi:hypothetical protein